jgi:hypothetical protein
MIYLFFIIAPIGLNILAGFGILKAALAFMILWLLIGATIWRQSGEVRQRLAAFFQKHAPVIALKEPNPDTSAFVRASQQFSEVISRSFHGSDFFGKVDIVGHIIFWPETAAYIDTLRNLADHYLSFTADHVIDDIRARLVGIGMPMATPADVRDLSTATLTNGVWLQRDFSNPDFVMIAMICTRGDARPVETKFKSMVITIQRWRLLDYVQSEASPQPFIWRDHGGERTLGSAFTCIIYAPYSFGPFFLPRNIWDRMIKPSLDLLKRPKLPNRKNISLISLMNDKKRQELYRAESIRRYHENHQAVGKNARSK